MTEEVITATHDVSTNLQRINERIAACTDKYGRKANTVKLIAVSKTQPLAAVVAAVKAGQIDFGENTVQDASTKIPHVSASELQWHFIGHLQSGKAKFIPSLFQWVHALDNVHTAVKLAQAAEKAGCIINTLIQVNVTQDTKKSGVASDRLFPLMEELLALHTDRLHWRGLMTIGPQDGAEAELRQAFSQLRELRDTCASRYKLPRFTELSMGMSNDYVSAIAEGATMIRLGSAIFGQRNYRGEST